MRLPPQYHMRRGTDRPGHDQRFRTAGQAPLNFSGELIVDNFAGGGGASTGIEWATGRQVDIAVNHDPMAIAVHEANHPHTRHFCESVWDIDPREVTGGQPVGLAWFSPDCRHFSKAKGTVPVSKKIRGLSWVVMRWIGTVRPALVLLENVEEILGWGPLIKDENGDSIPCPKRKGNTFRSFVNAIKSHGYKVEYRELRACDYGSPTIRKRLFLIARCDGNPIIWPEQTHGDPKSEAVKKGLLKPWVPMADCVDWSLPMQSIFDRPKPLVEATLRRIAQGTMRYVVENPEPFIVGRYGERKGQTPRTRCTQQPLATIVPTGNHGSLVVPHITKFRTGSVGSAMDLPLPTITAGGDMKRPAGAAHAMGVASAFMAKHYTGVVGTGLEKPLGTITSKDHHSPVAAFMMNMKGSNRSARPAEWPATTICAGGTHAAAVAALLHRFCPSDAFNGASPVIVQLNGEPWAIIDIGMRMLQPHELFAAQGFPEDYIFNRTADGDELPGYVQNRLVGNSVCPKMAEVLVRANYSHCAQAIAA